MTSSDRVKQYFSGRAEVYESLFKDNASIPRKIYELRWRPMLHCRQYTFECLDNLDGKNVLDVGCGTGYYAIKFAQQKARVTALDFTEQMITAARERAHQEGLEKSITFVLNDFLTWSAASDERFDVALAIGVLDYAEDPSLFLERMTSQSGTLIVTFPRRDLLLMPIRKLRYALLDVYNRFFSYREILQLINKTNYEIRNMRPYLNGYWVHAQRPDLLSMK